MRRHLPLRSLAAGAALVTVLSTAPAPHGFAQDNGARRSFTDHSVPRGEYRIYARDYPGEDPPFVLMHGFPDNTRLYDRLVPELAGRRVIVFDFLGWGESDKPRDHPYTFANQAADLDAVVNYFDLQQASLVAHDAAGPAAVNWALDHPDRTASLTLMNAFYAPTPTTRPPALIALFILAAFGGPVLGVDLTTNLAALSEQVTQPETFRRLFTWQERKFFKQRRDADHFIPLFFRQFAGKNSSREPLLALTGDSIAAVGANAGRVPELASFPRPIRLIWGEQDPDLNTGVAQTFHDASPTSELFVLTEAHHNLQIDEPKRVAELLLTIPPSSP